LKDAFTLKAIAFERSVMRGFRRKLGHLGIALLLAGGTVGWTAATASPAEACSLSSHCYGEAYGHASGIDGDYVTITPSCMYAPSGTFVTNELWLSDSANSYWVEVGYLSEGSGLNIGGIASAGNYAFWADSRPNGGGFHAHSFMRHPAAGEGVEIYKIDSSDWGVYFAADFGESTSNSYTPYNGIWGSETSSASTESHGTGESAEYETGNDNWYTGVPNPNWFSDSPETFSWNNDYYNYTDGVPC
jgi:hypothetical protein